LQDFGIILGTKLLYFESFGGKFVNTKN